MGDQYADDSDALRARLEALPQSIGPLVDKLGTPHIEEPLRDLDHAWAQSRAFIQAYVEALAEAENRDSAGRATESEN